ncbi:MAG: ABC transporter substrate-binding protein [Verrucomicrobia bacterium]|nr:ABC transporter substrate-binding protein [Verrucomicrobiota bacterium]MBI3870400.1 ABC transporter substrate-binding protein [Verrucomicrobiota bacterium]
MDLPPSRSSDRWVLSVVFLCLASLAARGAEELVVISPHNDAIRYEFGRAFSEWCRTRDHRDVRVQWRDVGGSSEALRFVQSEFAKKPQGIGVDCFFGGGLEPHVVLARKNLLRASPPGEELLRFVPTQLNGIDLYDPGHRWHGAAISSFGILQNLEAQRRVGLPEAKRWEDLADPRLMGWVGAGDPRTSGTMMVMYEGILQFHGWEKGWRVLTQMAGNARRFDRVSSTTAKDVTVGETAYGLAIDFYGFSQVSYAGDGRLAFLLPADFAPVSPDPISVLQGAPHLELALRFVQFVVGEPGQKLWYLPKGHAEGAVRNSIERMPVRKDLYERYGDVSRVRSSPFQNPDTFNYNGKKSGDRRDILPVLLGALLVDTHEELQSAWRAVIQRGASEAELARLGRAPVSEDEVMRLAAGPWKTNAFRLQKRIEWQTWAGEKYRQIVRGPAIP